MKKLVIAEKPSVAANIANVIGAREKADGFYYNENYIVSWCVGHLVELKDAAEYDEKYKQWDIRNLPIMPEVWQYKAVQSTKKQLTILYKLMRREDVASLVCATDAGREGEAIFRRVYDICKCTKPVERLWVSSLEEKGIRKAWSEMKSDKEYDNLFKAADARNKADWLVGINGTVLYTLRFNDRSVYSIGRVQTPTLKMIADRDEAIENFVSKPLYTVSCEMESDGITWRLASKKFEDKSEAERALSTVREHNPVITDIEQKEVKKFPFPLYSLTDLQRDANRYYGFNADKTLAVLQQLYEKKLTTYPRTDSQFITSDMEQTLVGLSARLRKKFGLDDTCSFRPAKVCVNNEKVSDHHAILVTGTCLGKIENDEEFSSDENALISLITARMMMALSTPVVMSETKVLARSEDVELAASGSQILSPGFLAVEKIMLPRVAERRKDSTALPAGIRKGEVTPKSVGILEGSTVPPKPYTDDTLLLAMEKAGAKEMDKDVERKGIGTSATRAAIIKRLEDIKYICRTKGKGKATALHVTDKGKKILAVVPEKISSPELTAEWENKLLEIERGRYDADDFEKEIREYVASFVEQEGKDIVPGQSPYQQKGIAKCPVCGKDVTLRGPVASCSCGRFKLYAKKKIWYQNKSTGENYSTEIQLPDDALKALIEKGECKVAVTMIKKKVKKDFIVKFNIKEYKEDGWVPVSFEIQPKG